MGNQVQLQQPVLFWEPLQHSWTTIHSEVSSPLHWSFHLKAHDLWEQYYSPLNPTIPGSFEKIYF